MVGQAKPQKTLNQWLKKLSLSSVWMVRDLVQRRHDLSPRTVNDTLAAVIFLDGPSMQASGHRTFEVSVFQP
jgi:hypothetical protein